MNSKVIWLEFCDDPTCPCNQWIPPTDEERVMFANVAGRKVFSIEYAEWYFNESGHYPWSRPYEIAESLALDGMDIADVSKIEELMR